MRRVRNDTMKDRQCLLEWLLNMASQGGSNGIVLAVPALERQVTAQERVLRSWQRTSFEDDQLCRMINLQERGNVREQGKAPDGRLFQMAHYEEREHSERTVHCLLDSARLSAFCGYDSTPQVAIYNFLHATNTNSFVRYKTVGFR